MTGDVTAGKGASGGWERTREKCVRGWRLSLPHGVFSLSPTLSFVAQSLET